MKILLIAVALALVTTWSVEAADSLGVLWNKNCLSCHGKDGKGETKAGKKAGVKDMTDPAYQAALKEDVAFKAIKEGLEEGGKSKMKPFKDKLTDDEIKQLFAFVKTFGKK